MSDFHKKCSPGEPPKKPPPSKLLTTKAFCDCNICTCRNCPDVLKMLSITISDTTCHFGLKAAAPNDGIFLPSTGSMNETLKILDVVDQKRNCNCTVVAKGLQDHIHTNLGMQDQRDEIETMADNCDQQRCQSYVHADTNSDQSGSAEYSDNDFNQSPRNSK